LVLIVKVAGFHIYVCVYLYPLAREGLPKNRGHDDSMYLVLTVKVAGYHTYNLNFIIFDEKIRTLWSN
jgi:hypothetical protein